MWMVMIHILNIMTLSLTLQERWCVSLLIISWIGSVGLYTGEIVSMLWPTRTCCWGAVSCATLRAATVLSYSQVCVCLWMTLWKKCCNIWFWQFLNSQSHLHRSRHQVDAEQRLHKVQKDEHRSSDEHTGSMGTRIPSTWAHTICNINRQHLQYSIFSWSLSFSFSLSCLHQIFGFLVCMGIILAIGNAVWEKEVGSLFQSYLPWDPPVDNFLFSAFLSFWSYVIILNTVVPISLYVR